MVDASDRGGIATYSDALVLGLRKAGIEVHLCAPGDRAEGAPRLANNTWGPEVEAMRRHRLYALRLGELPRAAASLLGAVRSVRPDVVHMQTEVVPRLDATILRTIRRRAAVVITAHDPVPHKGGVNDLVRQARRWRAADAVVIHGQEPKRLVEASSGRAIVRVVPVDLPFGPRGISRSEARERLAIPVETPIALLFGLLRPYKGLSLLAQAWPGVVKADPRARLYLVGEAYDARSELHDLERLGGVEIHEGWIDEALVDAWLAAPDVLLLPYHHGTHSGVLTRGLLSGTPALVSPPLSGEAFHAKAGRVVPLDPDAWTDAILGALGPDPIPPPPFPSGDNTIAGTIAVYREVLARRRRGPAGLTEDV